MISIQSVKRTSQSAVIKAVRCGAIGLLSILCLLTAGGCRMSERDILWYQDPLSSVTLTEGDRLWQLTAQDGAFLVTVTSPALPSPLCFTLAEEGCRIEAEGLCIPVTDGMTGGAQRICSLFSLKAENLENVERASKKESSPDGVCVIARYRTEGGSVQIHIGEDSLPLYFEVTENENVTRFTVTEYIPVPKESADG